MQSALCRRDDVALVFNRTGAQQQFPMRLAGRVGKRGRQQQNIKRLLGAEKLRKAQIVADTGRQRNIVHAQLRHIAARQYRIGFGVAFAQTGKAEKVHFVVKPDSFAVAVIHQHRVHHLARVWALQRNCTAKQHHAAFPCRFA